MKHLDHLLFLTGCWLNCSCMSYAEIACKKVQECGALSGDPLEQCVARLENLVPKEQQPACAACFEAKNCEEVKAGACGAQCLEPGPEPVASAPCMCQSGAIEVHSCYAARAPEEWQGFLQEVCTREPCNDYGSCGAARACTAGSVCGPCVADSDCLVGELCVLDNCLLAERVECRTRKDCDPDRVCMIADDGAAATWRGNAGLVAGCSNSDLIRNAFH